MRIKFKSWRYILATCVLSLAIWDLLPGAMAQTPTGQDGQSTTAAAAAVSGWKTDTAPASGQPTDEAAPTESPAMVLSPEQLALIERINSYLNDLVDVEGKFVQTDHRNEEQQGEFYVHRPGKLRFDYSSPSKLRIVSDGEYLSIEDHDLKTVDKFPLDATPIQLLLGKEVNLIRDAIILDMRQDENAVVILLKDRSSTAAGKLQIFFKLPELELYEWVITDAQGLETRIQLADLQKGDEKSSDFFKSSSIELERLIDSSR